MLATRVVATAELRREDQLDLGARQLARQREHLGQRGRERLLEDRRPAYLRRRLVDAFPLAQEGVEAALERTVCRDGLDEIAHALEVVVRGRGEQVLEVVEVDIDGPQRDTGSLGDLSRCGSEVPVVEQRQKGVDD